LAFKLNKVLILVFTIFSACSNNHEGAHTSSPSSPPPQVPPVLTHLPDNVIKSIDAIAKMQYEKDCIREIYYYCPPLDEVHRATAMVDTCEDNKVLSISDCEEVLECIPTNEVIEVVACVNENGMNGYQNIYCYKGFYEYGLCDPCDPEICDGEDNDCDGETDEGEYPCSTECGDGIAICLNGVLSYCNAETPEEEICDGIDNNCNGEIDEGQLNKCGNCGLEPEEICDGIDNDCDGLTDEDLLQECSTACEAGLEYCIDGMWQCTATPPTIEICDGLDNDCDGQVDEELNCLCKASDVGKLIPCKEKPLVCGEGYKTCECTDETCTEFQLSECLAVCNWIPEVLEPTEVCDIYLGKVKPEECNNHDDNCNQLVDEDLKLACYDGPVETIEVGICKAGEIMCHAGSWGNYDDSGVFIDQLCLGQIIPEPEDICNGADSNCDGKIDEEKELEPTDILFIVDMSGSMGNEINAVLTALNQFAAYYSDAEVVKWGLLLVAVNSPGDNLDRLHLTSNLTTFQQFMGAFSNISSLLAGGNEMTNDAIYLAIYNIVDAANLSYSPQELNWKTSASGLTGWGIVGESIPPLDQFEVNWRDDANRVIILFTDEHGQSYLYPDGSPSVSGVSNSLLVYAILGALNLKIYVFSLPGLEQLSIGGGWGAVTLNNTAGKFYALTNSAIEMYNNLLEILDETACSKE